MRIVGQRQSEPGLRPQASAQALRRGLAVVDAAATFTWATSTGQQKGVYRFKTFEAMEQHRIDGLARAMAQLEART
jgi:acyl-CoA reductase-like NAD-dependent aldehyde dehydrogenase